MSDTSIKIPLKYKIRNSILDKDAPAIFLLHGYGTNMNDLFPLSQFFSENWVVISLQAPFYNGFGGYAWAELDLSNLRELPNPEQKPISIEKIHNSISTLSSKFNLDKNQIYILGFSQAVSYTHLTLPTILLV